MNDLRAAAAARIAELHTELAIREQLLSRTPPGPCPAWCRLGAGKGHPWWDGTLEDGTLERTHQRFVGEVDETYVDVAAAERLRPDGRLEVEPPSVTVSADNAELAPAQARELMELLGEAARLVDEIPI